jgi:hypothetical protein
MGNILNYSGINNESINANLLSLIQELSKNSVPSKTMVKQTIMSSIELLDNALRHGVSQDISIKLELLADGVQITVCNDAKLPDILRLQEIVRGLLRMTKPELNALYLSKLKEGVMSDKGGAGLGIIQVIKNGAKHFSVTYENKLEDVFRCCCIVNFEKIA